MTSQRHAGRRMTGEASVPPEDRQAGTPAPPTSVSPTHDLLTMPKVIVVIGLPETAIPLAHQIAAIQGPPIVRGVVLLHPPASHDGRDASPTDLSPTDLTTILGTVIELPLLAARYRFDAAVVTLPVAMSQAIQRIRSTLEELGVGFRYAPPMYDIIMGMNLRHGMTGAIPGTHSSESCATTGTHSSENCATIVPPTYAAHTDYARLAGRRPRPIESRLVRQAIGGRRVAITGAGGSIGSELSRIAAAYEPAELLLIERSENALFEIDRELAGRFPNVARKPLLHDVVEELETSAIFERYRPEVVFHAAAHKHVPMMEDHPAHAINNNVFGTKSVADAALATGAERFVLISSDKAVNPSSVMGATKRFAELYVRSLNRGGRTRFSMVRFGNVLGSSGSVLTVWSKQIAAGRPITITDPGMTRYFMTIPEAAALVIQTAGLDEREACGADVFVLDMGEPVRIVELAERFIEAHGLSAVRPGRDRHAHSAPAHPIVLTGARPGEKLHEELAHMVEELRPTSIAGVNAWAGSSQSQDESDVLVNELAEVRKSLDPEEALAIIRKWTPSLQKQGARPIEMAIPAAGAA